MEFAPLPSPGFYSRLFVVWKSSGSWRPVIDLSTLNRFVDVSHFQMETIQSVRLSVRQGDWMASIDLREAYLQVPVHPALCPMAKFTNSRLCALAYPRPRWFSLGVMAPVSAILHSMGIHMSRYLDDWLVQSSSREFLLRDLQVVLDLCRELGIVVNPEKSNQVPSQVVQYLGVIVDAQSFVASPSPERVSRLLSTAGEFQSSASPPASVWLSLVSSMAHLVPGGRLHMQSLQLRLHQSWDRVDQSAPVAWSPECLQDLQWWLHLPGVSRLRLMVRCHGRWVGCSSRSPHRFRPLGRGGNPSPYQRQGAAGHPSRSPPLSVVSVREDRSGLLRQRHHCGVPAQSWRHQVSLDRFHRSGDPALVGVALHPSGSTIHPWLQQRPRGRSVSPSPTSAFRVVPQHGSLSVFESCVASSNRFVCHLSKSPLFDMFLSLPRPSVSGHRRLSPVLERSSGICFFSICHHSQSS